MARTRKATGMSTLRERVSFPMDCSAFLSERHGRWRRQNRPYGQQAEACASMSAPACAACGDKEDGTLVQSLFGDEGPAGNPRIGGRHARPDRQSAAAVRDLRRLLRPHCPKPTRGSRADDGAVGDAFARLCAEGQELRSGCHQRPECQISALAALAREREPLRGALDEFFRERGAAGRLPSDGLVRFDEIRPLAFFAGIWTRWTSVRKVKEGETTNDIFAFLTTEPNKEVGAIHPNAMPVVLTARQEIDVWMNAPAEEALKLQRPLPDNSLKIVARGDKKDEGGLAA